MSVITPNMSLVTWNANSDPYNHTELAANFTKIDVHDHTPGKGKPIGAGALADGSIGTAQLADGAVTTPKIADNAVTAAKMDRAYVHPLGGFMLWWRPSTAVAVPTGWVICQGQTLASSEHDFAGGGSITLPNLNDEFLKAVTSLSDIGSTGGVATVPLSHTHDVNNHAHHIPAHKHIVTGHAHLVNLYTSYEEAREADTAAGTDFFTAGINPHSAQGHRHLVYGITELGGNIDTSEIELDSQAGGNAGTDSQLGSVTNIPPFFGVLPLIKVKLT